MNVTYLTPLIVENIRDDMDKLMADFCVQVDSWLITVPTGFLTDESSVPRIPLAYWLMGGTGDRAGVVHDWLYSNDCPIRKGRAWADRVFKAALRAQGLPAWRAQIMYAGVRLGGASRYRVK